MQSNIFLVYGTAKPGDVGNGGGGGGAFFLLYFIWFLKSPGVMIETIRMLISLMNIFDKYQWTWKFISKICKSKFANRLRRKISTEAKKCTAWYKQKTTDKCHNKKTPKTLNPFQATLNWHSLKYKAKNKLQTTLTSWQSFKSNYQCSLVVLQIWWQSSRAIHFRFAGLLIVKTFFW